MMMSRTSTTTGICPRLKKRNNTNGLFKPFAADKYVMSAAPEYVGGGIQSLNGDVQ